MGLARPETPDAGKLMLECRGTRPHGSIYANPKRVGCDFFIENPLRSDPVPNNPPPIDSLAGGSLPMAYLPT